MINWFDLPVHDMARARAFYESVLGRPLGDMPGPDGASMPVFKDGDNMAGCLVPAGHYGDMGGPSNAPSATGMRVYLHSDDIDAALEQVTAGGGEVLIPKTPIGPHGHMAHFTDSEGNAMALHTPAAG